jgi:Flp pilus assembly protein TadB
MTPLIAAMAAMAVLGGVLLVISGARPAPVPNSPTGTLMFPARRRQQLLSGPDRLSPRTRVLALAGLAAGGCVWLLTGWLIAVVIAPVAFAGLPVLLMTNEGGASINRLEAMEEWTRSLAGVLTVGVGLEQAIIATLRSTPDPIRPEVATLVARLRARWTTGAALRAFADDLDDATGDLIASSLLLGASRRGTGLASVLEGLAQTVAEDVRIRRAIEADRAKPRAAARWITLLTVGVLVLMPLNSDYIAPYGTPFGQLVLTLLLAAYIGCLRWLRQMARGTRLPRFIGTSISGPGVVRR